MKIELNADQIKELSQLIKEGHFKISSSETSIKEFLDGACGWLCSLYGGMGQAPSWVVLLNSDGVAIEKTGVQFPSLRGHENLLALRKSQLESTLRILEDFRNEYNMSLQLKELHEQTKSSRLAITISIIGLAIAVVMPSLLSKCSQDIKLDKKQFEELKETVNRRPIVVDSTCSIKCINIQDRKLIN